MSVVFFSSTSNGPAGNTLRDVSGVTQRTVGNVSEAALRGLPTGGVWSDAQDHKGQLARS